jgi:hypothetical protein
MSIQEERVMREQEFFEARQKWSQECVAQVRLLSLMCSGRGVRGKSAQHTS